MQYISTTLQTDSIFMCITQLLQKSHRRPQKGQRGHRENTGHWLLQNGEQWGELVPLTSVPVTLAFLHTHEYVMANLTRTVSERLILSMCSLPHSAENTLWGVPKGKCWSKHVTFAAISTPELTVVNGFTQSPTKRNRSCDFNSCLNSVIALPPLSSSLDAGIEPILRCLIMKHHPLWLSPFSPSRAEMPWWFEDFKGGYRKGRRVGKKRCSWGPSTATRELNNFL